MKLCTPVQEGCGYKYTLRVHCYSALSAKYFTVCITYQPPLVKISKGSRQWGRWTAGTWSSTLFNWTVSSHACSLYRCWI